MTVKNVLKQSLKRLIVATPSLRMLTSKAAGDFPRVFVYHRFAPAGTHHPHRVAADVFGWQLDQIRKAAFRLITFADLVHHYHTHGVWPPKSAVITVDDGYRDFYEFAYPELKKRGLPATLFVTVGFVDKSIWLWPDRLYCAILNTQKRNLQLVLNGSTIRLPLGSRELDFNAWKFLSDHCIALHEKDKWKFIATVEKFLEVDLPRKPFSEYAACTWEELSEMNAHNIEIGSHTMTHPVLSHIDIDAIEKEVSKTKMILEANLKCTVNSFCYPNGKTGDVTDDIISQVRKSGYTGAPLGTDFNSWNDVYRVPRLGVSNKKLDFHWKLCGGEWLNQQPSTGHVP